MKTSSGFDRRPAVGEAPAESRGRHPGGACTQSNACFYGERPGLASLEKNNLRFTTDFRQVYASVLEGWLGAPSEDVLGGRFERLPLFVPGAAAY